MSQSKELAGRQPARPDSDDGYGNPYEQARSVAAYPALDTLSPPEGVGLVRWDVWVEFDKTTDYKKLRIEKDVDGEWVRYEDAAAALATEKARADEAEERVEEIESEAKSVSREFEGDLWKAIRSVVEQNPGFNWRDYEPDGMMADDVVTLFDEDMREAWAQSERAVKRADAAEARCDTLAGALKSVLDACDQGRVRPAPGCGVGGMTIEANIRGSVYYGVPAWPIEEAREAYYAALATIPANPETEET